MKKIRNVPQVLFGGRLKIVFVGRERELMFTGAVSRTGSLDHSQAGDSVCN